MSLTHLELMNTRLAAMYRYDDRQRMVSVNQMDGGTAPRFYLGRTNDGNLWRLRFDVPGDLAGALATSASQEPSTSAIADLQPSNRHTYLRLLGEHSPIEQVWAGPAFCFPTHLDVAGRAMSINADNAHLLRGGLEDWLPDVAHRRPFMAIVEDGQAVAVCASVRITAQAHEAGVETLPDYRRRGHAVSVVAGWAAAVRQLGAEPFYSTAWSNLASQRVAARLALIRIGVDFHLT